MSVGRSGDDIVISSKMAWVAFGGVIAGGFITAVFAAWNLGTTVALHTHRLDVVEHRVDAIELDRKAEQDARYAR